MQICLVMLFLIIDELQSDENLVPCQRANFVEIVGSALALLKCTKRYVIVLKFIQEVIHSFIYLFIHSFINS